MPKAKNKIKRPEPPIWGQPWNDPDDFEFALEQYELNKIEWAASLQNSGGVHSSNPSGKQKILLLYLAKEGNLYREPRERYCYPMSANSDRFRIVLYLAQNSGFRETSDISLALEGKDKQLIRTEIRKIRENIKKYLKLNGKKVIESKRDSGYRIHPNCKIRLVGF